MTDYDIFIVKLKLAEVKRVFEANLITYDTYIYASEQLNKRLIDGNPENKSSKRCSNYDRL